VSGALAGPGAPETEEFRLRVRGWLRTHRPRSIEGLPSAEAVTIAKEFQAALFDAGLAGITWPREYGGQGLSAAEQQAFDEEAVEYELPTYPFMVSMGMCGPTLADLGTHQQKSRYLPRLLRGEEIWCQLFSEPGAGSDVASLQTRARRDGDGWVVSGQKIWTSRAQMADFGALLARTDPDLPKHAGITMFILDMHAPGVTVRPLQVMSGKSPFNQVFLDDVRIPADAVVGTVNAGWQAAVTMLGHERVHIGSRRPAKANALSYDALLTYARTNGTAAEAGRRERLAEFYAHERALELLNARMRQETLAGRPPGARGSVTKLSGATQLRRAVKLLGDIAGPEIVAWTADDETRAEIAAAINAAPSTGIAGGTSEVQRNIIGERVLGLPKEPQVDRDVPFRELRVGTQRKGTGK
jgi:alkylation response protein AidB-like acyl-CoA dehydrogenase